MHILIFISWKKGPRFWLDVTPTIFYWLTNTCYIIVPAFLCLYSDRRWETIKSSPVYLQLFVCIIVQFFHLINFYLLIYKQVFPEAKKYIERRERRRTIEEQIQHQQQ